VTPGNVGLLLKYRLKSLANNFKRFGLKKSFRPLSILMLGTLFVVGDYWFFHRVIVYLDGLPFRVGDELIVQLVNLVFITLFMMVLFSSLIVSLSVYYLSQDLELLHSLPISIWSVVAARYFQCMANSSWMVLLFSLPMFAAYGSYFDASWDYYLYLLFNLFPFIAIPCLLAVLGMMVLMKVYPTHKTHQILTFLGIFFLVGVVVYLRFLTQDKFFGQDVSDEQIMAFVASLRAPDYPFLPSNWITRGLSGWVEGHREMPFKQSLTLWGVASGLFALLLWLGARIYFQGWCLTQEVRSAPLDAGGRKTKRKSYFHSLPISGHSRAMLIKDFKIFIRDPEQWSQLFILSALVCVYIFNIMHLPFGNKVLRDVVSVLNVGLVGFVMAALISRFVFTSTSVEGKSFWLIYTRPVTMQNFLASKFWMFFPPLLFIAELLVVVSNHILEVDDFVMKVSVIGVFLLTFGLTSLGLGLGTLYPKFDHENISEISSSSGGVLFMILALSYIGLVLMLGARPLYVHFNEKFLFKTIGGLEVPICYALIIILTWAVSHIPLKMGIRSLITRDI
jgi:ABC-2 type transport system permease protein